MESWPGEIVTEPSKITFVLNLLKEGVAKEIVSLIEDNDWIIVILM